VAEWPSGRVAGRSAAARAHLESDSPPPRFGRWHLSAGVFGQVLMLAAVPLLGVALYALALRERAARRAAAVDLQQAS
jgi:hypothetical protein